MSLVKVENMRFDGKTEAYYYAKSLFARGVQFDEDATKFSGCCTWRSVEDRGDYVQDTGDRFEVNIGSFMVLNCWYDAVGI